MNKPSNSPASDAFETIAAYAGNAALIVPNGSGPAYTVRKPLPRTANQLPLPPTYMRLGYGADANGAFSDELYLRHGADQMSAMRLTLQRGGFSFTPGQKILEFGCSSGRLIRHLAEEAKHSEIWGVDIHASHVEWCGAQLSPPFHFAATSSAPHLPFEDRSFDMIFAGSVFTHIPELADAWFLELRRIMRPNAFLWTSIIDDIALQSLGADQFRSLVSEFGDASSSFGIALQDCGKLVIRRYRSIQAPQVYYDRQFLTEKLARWFTVVSISDRAYGFQSGYLVSKS
jgi:ubiquinone/menaquinone biosynthesis C-methylase UbiE